MAELRLHDNRECFLGGNGCFTPGLLEFAVFEGGGDVGGVVVEDDILQVREVPGSKPFRAIAMTFFLGLWGTRGLAAAQQRKEGSPRSSIKDSCLRGTGSAGHLRLALANVEVVRLLFARFLRHRGLDLHAFQRVGDVCEGIVINFIRRVDLLKQQLDSSYVPIPSCI